jgi:hypothetical protein
LAQPVRGAAGLIHRTRELVRLQQTITVPRLTEHATRGPPVPCFLSSGSPRRAFPRHRPGRDVDPDVGRRRPSYRRRLGNHARWPGSSRFAALLRGADTSWRLFRWQERDVLMIISTFTQGPDSFAAGSWANEMSAIKWLPHEEPASSMGWVRVASRRPGRLSRKGTGSVGREGSVFRPVRGWRSRDDPGVCRAIGRPTGAPFSPTRVSAHRFGQAATPLTAPRSTAGVCHPSRSGQQTDPGNRGHGSPTSSVAARRLDPTLTLPSSVTRSSPAIVQWRAKPVQNGHVTIVLPTQWPASVDPAQALGYLPARQVPSRHLPEGLVLIREAAGWEPRPRDRLMDWTDVTSSRARAWVRTAAGHAGILARRRG